MHPLCCCRLNLQPHAPSHPLMQIVAVTAGMSSSASAMNTRLAVKGSDVTRLPASARFHAVSGLSKGLRGWRICQRPFGSR